MKRSDELRQQAQAEENDIKTYGIYTKVYGIYTKREERAEKFPEYVEFLLKKGFDVTYHESQGKYTIDPTDYGTVDYYPKVNKGLIRKDNKWIKPGLRWIVTNLLK